MLFFFWVGVWPWRWGCVCSVVVFDRITERGSCFFVAWVLKLSFYLENWEWFFRTLPAGYLEIGESAAEGAMRETWEEAGAEVEVVSPFAQLDIPLIGQVRMSCLLLFVRISCKIA